MADDSSTADIELTRRSLLAVVGLGGVRDVAIGGNPGGSSGYRYGRFSTAPLSLPPEYPEGGWTQRDTSTLLAGHSGTLPVEFSAAGSGWSLASDLTTAKSNAGTGPVIAIGNGGGIDVGYDGSLPQTHNADGVTVSIASDVATAKSRVSGAPAIAAGSDGVEVLVDG